METTGMEWRLRLGMNVGFGLIIGMEIIGDGTIAW
jgi:hypothetical protein